MYGHNTQNKQRQYYLKISENNLAYKEYVCK